VGRKRNTHLSEVEHQARATKLRNDRAFLEHCIGQMTGIDTEIQKRYRIYCLTPKPADTLMWSHYAEKHSGICLEYRCDNHVLSSALKVIYCDSYPSFDLADEEPDTALLPILCKAKDWSYEEEYRLIAQEQSAALNHYSLITNNNMLSLPENSLTSIIVGCVTAQSIRETVSTIIKRSGRRIELKEARRVPNHYSLSIASLTV
jgi:hypothetical protein